MIQGPDYSVDCRPLLAKTMRMLENRFDDDGCIDFEKTYRKRLRTTTEWNVWTW